MISDKMVLTLEDIIEMSEKPIFIKSPTLGKLTFRMFLAKDEEIILNNPCIHYHKELFIKLQHNNSGNRSAQSVCQNRTITFEEHP